MRVPAGDVARLEAGAGRRRILVFGAPNLGEDPRGDVDGERGW